MNNVVKESEARTAAIGFTRLVNASADYLRDAIRRLDPSHAHECCGDIKRLTRDIETQLNRAFPVSFDPIALGM